MGSRRNNRNENDHGFRLESLAPIGNTFTKSIPVQMTSNSLSNKTNSTELNITNAVNTKSNGSVPSSSTNTTFDSQTNTTSSMYYYIFIGVVILGLYLLAWGYLSHKRRKFKKGLTKPGKGTFKYPIIPFLAK